MKLDKRYQHLFIAIITGLALILNTWFTLKYINEHYLSVNFPDPNKGYSTIFYFSFLTHWCNIIVFLWYSISFMLSFFDKEFKIFNSYFVKGLVSTVAILVGIVIFIPLLGIIIRDVTFMTGILNDKNFDSNMSISQEMYYFTDLVSNLLVHFTIPLLVMLEVSRNGFKKTKNDRYAYIFTSAIFILYFIFVVALLATGVIWKGPYPHVNFWIYNSPIEVTIAVLLNFASLAFFNYILFFTMKHTTEKGS